MPTIPVWLFPNEEWHDRRLAVTRTHSSLMDKIADTLRAPKPSTADNSAAEAVETHSMADGRKYLDTGWNEENDENMQKYSSKSEKYMMHGQVTPLLVPVVVGDKGP